MAKAPPTISLAVENDANMPPCLLFLCLGGWSTPRLRGYSYDEMPNTCVRLTKQ